MISEPARQDEKPLVSNTSPALTGSEPNAEKSRVADISDDAELNDDEKADVPGRSFRNNMAVVSMGRKKKKKSK